MSAKLKVSLISFSYKRGLPEDPTPNGGGFVFDCRCLPNPGRDEKYQKHTGLDQEVCNYLERYSEVEEFAQHTAHLVEQAVQNYLERGFTDLMVCFGCTGGQHRSVYFVERLARHLKEKVGVTTSVKHCEIESMDPA